jgi:hypothetical protein
MQLRISYHFWSKWMPRHSRSPKSNRNLKSPTATGLEYTRRCWQASERFVMLAAMSVGFLQLLSLKYTHSVWQKFQGFLRTRSRDLPSEGVVKEVVARQVAADFFAVAPEATMREMRTCPIDRSPAQNEGAALDEPPSPPSVG